MSTSPEEVIAKRIDFNSWTKYSSSLMDLFMSRFGQDAKITNNDFSARKGLRRNIPNLDDYQSLVDEKIIDGYFATIGAEPNEKIIGFMFYFEISKQKSRFLSFQDDNESFKHQIKFINEQINLQSEESEWHFVLLDLVVMHKNYRDSDVFKILWTKLKSNITATSSPCFFSLISPFNLLLIQQYQEVGFFLLLNSKNQASGLFECKFNNHWIFQNRTINWLPLMHESRSYENTIMREDKSKKGEIRLTTKYIYKHYDCCELDVPTNSNYHFKSRLCGCLLFTTHEKTRMLPSVFTRIVPVRGIELRSIDKRLKDCAIIYNLLLNNSISNYNLYVIAKIRESNRRKASLDYKRGLKSHVVYFGSATIDWEGLLEQNGIFADVNYIPHHQVDIYNFSTANLPENVDHVIMPPLYFFELYNYTAHRYCTVEEKIGFFNKLLECLIEKQATLYFFEISDLLPLNNNYDVSEFIHNIFHAKRSSRAIKTVHYFTYYLLWYLISELVIVLNDWRSFLKSKQLLSGERSKRSVGVDELRNEKKIDSDGFQFKYVMESIEPRSQKLVRMSLDGSLQANNRQVISVSAFQSEQNKIRQPDYQKMLRHENDMNLPMCAAEFLNHRREIHCIDNVSTTVLFIVATEKRRATSIQSLTDKNLIEVAFPDHDSIFCKQTYYSDQINMSKAISSSLHISKTSTKEGDPIFTAFIWFQDVHKSVWKRIGVLDANESNNRLISILLYRYSPGLQGFVEYHEHRTIDGAIQVENIREFVSRLNDYAIMSLEKAFRERTDKAAIAAIMSRNMSHNIGSHSLSNPRFWISLGKELSEKENRLLTFNYYCQGRLDFIARVISGLRDKAETMLLIKEVLFGFMEQKVLLDTLLDDCGVTTNNFKMVIHSGSDKIVWNYSDKSSFPQMESPLDDVWVDIVGGTTGCHALYAIFENILRNAVKYSKSYSDPLELHIRFITTPDAEKRNRYNFAIWDNWTGKDSYKNISFYLSQPIEDFSLTGHGFREIRCCANYLHAVEKRNIIASVGIDECPDAVGKIVYNMEMPKPAFMAIYASPLRNVGHFSYSMAHQKEIDLENARRKGVYFCLDVKSIASVSPLLGVLEIVKKEAIRSILADIAQHHTVLPFRLLLVTHKKNIYESCKELIDNISANIEKKQFYPKDSESLNEAFSEFKNGKNVTILPRNRIQILLTSGDKSIFEDIQTDWGSLFLMLWTEWIKKWKPAYLKWNIVVGLGSDGNPNKWKSTLESLVSNREAKPVVDLINIYIKSGNDGQAKIHCISEGEYKLFDEYYGENDAVDQILPKQDKNVIVFDRHGNSIRACQPKYVGMYQPFSGDQLALYAFLSSPPQDTISSSVYLLSILESGLLCVGVLDERVAESLLEENGNKFKLNLESKFSSSGLKADSNSIRYTYQDLIYTNINPFYTVQVNATPPLLITSKLEPGMGEASVLKSALDFEGIRFNKDTGEITIRRFDNDSPTKCADIVPDVLIIHEGIVDQYPSNQWMSSYFSLYTMMSAIIRTSGRGNEPRAFVADVPFLEFNVVSDSCFGSLDKIKLSRAVMSII